MHRRKLCTSCSFLIQLDDVWKMLYELKWFSLRSCSLSRQAASQSQLTGTSCCIVWTDDRASMNKVCGLYAAFNSTSYTILPTNKTSQKLWWTLHTHTTLVHPQCTKMALDEDAHLTWHLTREPRWQPHEATAVRAVAECKQTANLTLANWRAPSLHDKRKVDLSKSRHKPCACVPHKNKVNTTDTPCIVSQSEQILNYVMRFTRKRDMRTSEFLTTHTQRIWLFEVPAHPSSWKSKQPSKSSFPCPG